METYIDQLSQRLYPDANNNGEKIVRGDKYSLRPRSLRKGEEDEEEGEIRKRTRGGKLKQKAAPLSKYRRKTANARERSRMREINAAFEALRKCVPAPLSSTPLHSSHSEKLTKITTLRLAMKYISALSAVLNDTTKTNITSDLGDLLSDCSDLDCFLLESDGESLPLSDHSLLTSPEFSDPGLSPSSLLPTDFTDNTEFGEIFLT